MTKTLVEITIRFVVGGEVNCTFDDMIDNLLERALQDKLCPGLYTPGFVSAKHMNTEIIHTWEENDGGTDEHDSKTKLRLPKVRRKKG
jgi:hypothetical protein